MPSITTHSLYYLQWWHPSGCTHCGRHPNTSPCHCGIVEVWSSPRGNPHSPTPSHFGSDFWCFELLPRASNSSWSGHPSKSNLWRSNPPSSPVTEPSIFIKLYFDEEVSVILAEMLRPHGFDALTAWDAGILRNSDEAQLQFSAATNRTLFTHNRREFELLHKKSSSGKIPASGNFHCQSASLRLGIGQKNVQTF